MAQQKCPECEEGAPAWMLTFGDMISLILTFFILLVTMMVIDPKKYVETLGVFQNAAGEGFDKPTPDEPIPTEEHMIQIVVASSRRTTEPQGGMNPTVKGETPVVYSHKENYVAKVADTRFFEEFSCMLTTGAKIQLDYIAKLANESASNRIRLIGHYSRSEAPSRFERQAMTASTATGEAIQKGMARKFEYSHETSGSDRELESVNVWINDADELAYRRARAVLEYMAYRGVSRLRMTAQSGGMISDVKVASNVPQRQVDMTRGGRTYDIMTEPGKGIPGEGPTTDIHAGTVEAGELTPPMIETIESENTRTKGSTTMMRQWPHFIFTETGDDRGRTVEIVITGEIVSLNEAFAPPVSR